MAMITLRGQGNFETIAQVILDSVQASGISCTLVDNVSRNVGTAKLTVMVFEKYYMRASNRASLTVVMTGEGDQIIVDAIGAGGGQGAFFGFSWGAEEDFVGTVARALSDYGFK